MRTILQTLKQFGFYVLEKHHVQNAFLLAIFRNNIKNC